MADISNRFIVTALQDGQSIQGELAITRSLWQSIDDSGNVNPDWGSDPEEDKPVLYPLVMSAGVVQTPATTQWYYNNELIVFHNSTHLSTNASFPGKFKEIDYAIPQTGVSVKAVRIMDNLASSSNDDSDIIAVSGTVTVSDSTLAFDSMQTVTITKSEGSSSVGELILVGGKGTLDGDTDTVQIRAVLHNTNVSVTQTDYTCQWWWNGTKHHETTGQNDNHTITITGAEVTDYVMVECRFIRDGVQDAVAFIGIDDIGDKEMMQFAYTIFNSSGSTPTSVVLNNTTASTLKAGQSVLYGIWIGSKDDPLSQPAGDSTTYWSWSARIYSADKTDITNTSVTDKQIAQPVNNGTFTVGSTSLHNVATMVVSYARCVANGGTVSVVIKASHT